MNSKEAKDFLNQLEKLFGSVGEEVPSVEPHKPKGPRDTICVSLIFRTHFMKQEFVVKFNTLGDMVNVEVITPPSGVKIKVWNPGKIKVAIAEVRLLLELEARVFSRRQEKVQA